MSHVPRQLYESTFYTDFVSAITSGGAVNCDGGSFHTVNGGTGSGFSQAVQGDDGVDTDYRGIGIIAQTCGTTATSWNWTATNVLSTSFGFAKQTFVARSWVKTLGSALDSFEWTLGFMDNNNTATPGHTDGAYFLYTGDGSNLNFLCVTSVAGVRTTADSGVVVAALSDHEFKIEANEAGTSITFYIDGVLVATNTTNIPVATATPSTTPKFGFGSKALKLLGATNYYVFHDYMYYRTVWAGAR